MAVFSRSLTLRHHRVVDRLQLGRPSRSATSVDRWNRCYSACAINAGPAHRNGPMRRGLRSSHHRAMPSTPSPSDVKSAPRAWRGQPNVVLICYLVASLLMLSGLAHLGIALASDRPWSGPLSWRKPVTFGLSFGSTLASVTWVVSMLPDGTRARIPLLAVLAGDCVLEVLGITVQAWRHVPSHFNKETAFDAAVANALAAGGAVLVVVLVALGVSTWRSSCHVVPSLRLGVRAGFGILMAGLASGIAMVVRGVTLLGQGAVDGRWNDVAYAEAGFIKGFHGVTLHAVLVLPAMAFSLGQIHLSERARVRIMVTAVALYCVTAVAVLVYDMVG